MVYLGSSNNNRLDDQKNGVIDFPSMYECYEQIVWPKYIVRTQSLDIKREVRERSVMLSDVLKD